MELSSTEFHAQAFNIINTAINGAKELGLEINTMPPHLSVIEASPTFCDRGHIALMVKCSMPEILQDVDPHSWSWVAKCLLEKSENGIGFVFWCLVGNDEEDLIFGFSYQKGGDYNAFLCNTNFKNLRSVDPYDVVPYLHDDYESELVVH
tara:strand:- start:5778 stop:6227 length:450 start_codon:yes stop_codon:yes gene_type:complete